MMLHKRICLYYIQWFIVSTPTVFANMENDLIKYLFKNYSASSRPVINASKSINISFNMVLRQLISMDERAQKLMVQADYIVEWKNELLSWNPKDWGNLDRISLKTSQVWTPSLTLLNNADTNAPNLHDGTDLLTLSSNGECVWYPIVTLGVSFTHNVEYFPFDLQNCTFMFESWVLDVTKLNILRNNWSLVSQYYTNSPEWKVAKTEIHIYEKFYEGESYPYSQIHFTYMLLRKPSYYVISLILPCVLLMLIILFSHFLPAASGERMGVVITILLAFAVFLEVVSSSMPPNSDSTSVLSMFYLITMTMCALSFLATSIVITMTHNMSDSIPPMWARRYILRSASKKILKPQQHLNRSFQDIESGENCSSSVIQNMNKTSRRDGTLTPNNGPYFTETMDVTSQMRLIIQLQNDHLQIVRRQDEESKKEIIKEAEQKQIEKEWKLLAGHLDRLCFWLFLFLFISTSLGILMPAYHKYSYYF